MKEHSGINSPRKANRRRSGPYYNKKAMEVMRQEQQSMLAEAENEKKHEKELQEMGLVEHIKKFLSKCFYSEKEKKGS